MKFEELAKSFALKDLPEGEVELSGEVPFAEVEPYKKHALAHMAEHLEMPGFRKGQVPHDLVEKRVGEQGVLEEALDLFVKDFYPELIEARKLDAVGRPEIRITKLAAGNPVGVSVRASLYPKVEVSSKWKDLHTEVALEAVGDVKEDERAQKEFEAKQKRLGKLIELLLEESPINVPRIFIDSELEKIMAQMREDITRMGVSFEEYLKRAGKSEDDIRSEFREQARKRAQLQLILNKLAEEEKVEIDQELVAKEVTRALEHFPNAKEPLVRIHVETILKNEKVLKLLESGAKKSRLLACKTKK